MRVRQELLLSRARDVTVRKNGLQAVFGSGDVQVGAGSARCDQPVVFRDVPRANLVRGRTRYDLMDSNALVDDGGALADDGFRQAERG